MIPVSDFACTIQGIMEVDELFFVTDWHQPHGLEGFLSLSYFSLICPVSCSALSFICISYLILS